MNTMRCITLCLSLCLALAVPHVVEPRTAPLDKYRLPDGFLFGAGSSAYQVEGAWDADGKGENIFDHAYHKANVEQSKTGDVAADFYHRYKEDIDIAAQLGLTALRISLSWSRIFPTGRKNNVNSKGVQFYHNVLDYMRSKNIEPIVTIFHFDYPQTLLDEFGGWTSIKMSEALAEFSDFVFSEYGSKVKYWTTVNQAATYCVVSILQPPAASPPDTFSPEELSTCLHYLIIGHALAHKIYEEKYKAKYKGLVGFGVGIAFARPATDSDEDKEETDKVNLGLDEGLGVSLDALVFGDYPKEAKAESRPTFTEEQKNLLKGRIDWVGVNMYGGVSVSASDPAIPASRVRSLGQIVGGSGIARTDWNITENSWTLREVPRWIKSRYGNLPVFFTENGLPTQDTKDDWDLRAVYCSAFLRELAVGINVDGNNVFGYTLWAFTDTFEFARYDGGYGIVHVDFNGSLNRTLKASASFFKRVTRTWTVPLVEAGSEPFIEDIIVAPTQKPDSPSVASRADISVLLSVVTAWTLRWLLRTLSDVS